MSRIGKRELTIPTGVTVNIEDTVVTVTGPKGTITTDVTENVVVEIKENKITTSPSNDSKQAASMYGTANSNILNRIIGVTEGFSKTLEIVGVGYRFNIKGKTLEINAGFSHSVEKEIPEGLTVTANGNNEITITGIDNILVGEFAANVRKVRPPEPYKGKGIKYSNEHIRRKEGKKAA